MYITGAVNWSHALYTIADLWQVGELAIEGMAAYQRSHWGAKRPLREGVTTMNNCLISQPASHCWYHGKVTPPTLMVVRVRMGVPFPFIHSMGSRDQVIVHCRSSLHDVLLANWWLSWWKIFLLYQLLKSIWGMMIYHIKVDNSEVYKIFCFLWLCI